MRTELLCYCKLSTYISIKTYLDYLDNDDEGFLVR